jgi:hypothetical protein
LFKFCEDETINVRYEKLEAVLIPHLEEGDWQKPSEELLLQAFRSLEMTFNQMKADEEYEAMYANQEENFEKNDEGEGEGEEETLETKIKMKKKKLTLAQQHKLLTGLIFFRISLF